MQIVVTGDEISWCGQPRPQQPWQASGAQASPTPVAAAHCCGRGRPHSIRLRLGIFI